MKVCPHCHKDLPDDSTFCIYCGKPLKKVSMKDLEKAKEKISKQREMEKNDPSLKHNPREKSWSKLGLMIFLISLIGLDFIVATIVNGLGMNSKFIFIISLIGYICAIGVLSCLLLLIIKIRKKVINLTEIVNSQWLQL